MGQKGRTIKERNEREMEERETEGETEDATS